MTETDKNGIPLPELTHEVSFEDSQQVSEQLADFIRLVELTEYNLEQLQRFELKLLDAFSMAALIDVLVVESRVQFELEGVQLVLLDPEEKIRSDLPDHLDHGGRIIYVEDANEFQVLYGTTPEVERVTELTAPMADLFKVDRGMIAAVKMPLTHGDIIVGSLHWGSLENDRFDDKKTLEMIGHLSAVIGICIENCLNRERLNKLSLVDPLTRIGNHRMFDIELAKEISRADRTREPLTLAFVDLDGFPLINEEYGHSAGEQSLREISEKIGDLLRTTDSLCRYDEHRFSVLLPGCDEERAQEVCERIRHQVTEINVSVIYGQTEVALSASLGLTTWFPKQYPAVNMEQLSRQLVNSVNAALKKSTAQGGNAVSLARLTTLLL